MLPASSSAESGIAHGNTPLGSGDVLGGAVGVSGVGVNTLEEGDVPGLEVPGSEDEVDPSSSGK